ncbi:MULTISPECIES: Lrp/AsnC ligand binding domain-containing protein [Natrialba]|uniref:AsnC family transcriptional regulator n=2 Tax=Natrialba TaxID=63742 RepID=M0B3U7_9EURY|nr:MULTISPECIES: Lrp/AsnC ligand binding domain-containing protein [Natrialba]ELY95407.1 AsnC family transcriptional regulator [Natrialba taiwanensis DSM 12281]ELZ04344.1 AsnC family transcriptional regulator [Natrialba aegyptia DSM 13077]
MVEAYVLLMTAAGTARPVLASLRELDAVTRASIIAGEFDIIAEVEADSNQELLSLVTEQIQSDENVGRTRTCIVLE